MTADQMPVASIKGQWAVVRSLMTRMIGCRAIIYGTMVSAMLWHRRANALFYQELSDESQINDASYRSDLNGRFVAPPTSLNAMIYQSDEEGLIKAISEVATVTHLYTSNDHCEVYRVALSGSESVYLVYLTLIPNGCPMKVDEPLSTSSIMMSIDLESPFMTTKRVDASLAVLAASCGVTIFIGDVERSYDVAALSRIIDEPDNNCPWKLHMPHFIREKPSDSFRARCCGQRFTAAEITGSGSSIHECGYDHERISIVNDQLILRAMHIV